MSPEPPVQAPHAAAGRALSRGDALRALGLVGRSDDALGLALRGIAHAQLGDLALARKSLVRASRLTSAPLARARIQAALAEVAMSDGRLAEARHVVGEVLADTALPPGVRAVAWLARAELAVRATLAGEARDALKQARQAMSAAPNELLARTLVALEVELSQPVARLERAGVVRTADLFAIEAASSGEVLLVDACRRLVIGGRASIPLARRPILFSLLLVLARAWPNGVARDELAARAFETKRVNASHRSRLRVEVGRLRKLLAGLAEPVANDEGYLLVSARDVMTLLPPSEDDDARVAILLGDGASWSAQGLAEHAGISKRTAQRALAALVASGAATRSGTGKDVRYSRPGPRIASRMLLLGLVPPT